MHRVVVLLGGCGLATTHAMSAPPPEATTLDRIVVAARLEGVAAFDVPASIDAVIVDADSNGALIDTADVLHGIPGLLARDRQNHAQDTQLSIRGFGARSTFGVRGLRLYSDGIPATMPDGQGQLAHFNLLGADRIEILRGPFSALYGNSSGGVVQLFTADGTAPDTWRARARFGSDAARSVGARLLGAGDAIDYNIAVSHFDTDGYRDHSTARRESANAKFGIDIGDGGRLALVVNHYDAPDTLDPLGLTREQARVDPRQAVAAATLFDTRKSVGQQQLGLLHEHAIGNGHTLRLAGYGGQREVEQFLSIPVAVQANPLQSGGVIDLDNDYGGLDARWSWRGELAARPFEITAGANADRQRQHRRGFENFLDERLGVLGALRRDESNRVSNADQFAQAWWQFAPRWSLIAGLRHSEVAFRSVDAYTAAGNPDDSGRVRYAETTPVAGLSFAPHENLRLYLSAGRGFETPTFNELGYRADGGAGLAFDLRPAASRNLELGAKWRNNRGATFTAALFHAATDDELAVARNVGGRSSFRNVGSARRQGLEAAFAAPLGDAWDVQLAYTRLDAMFRNRFPICNAAGCTDPSVTVAAGTRIPGVPRDRFFGRLSWRRGDWSAAFEADGTSRVTANDTGDATAPGHVLLHLEAARAWMLGGHRIRTFARIDNLLDRAHIGSVIVNDGNGRYYEPGAERSVALGIEFFSRRPGYE